MPTLDHRSKRELLDEIMDLRDQIFGLKAEVAALKIAHETTEHADKARLDWVEKNRALIHSSTSPLDQDYARFSVNITGGIDWTDDFPTVRQAIDEAIRIEAAQHIPCGCDCTEGHCPQ